MDVEWLHTLGNSYYGECSYLFLIVKLQILKQFFLWQENAKIDAKHSASSLSAVSLVRLDSSKYASSDVTRADWPVVRVSLFCKLGPAVWSLCKVTVAESALSAKIMIKLNTPLWLIEVGNFRFQRTVSFLSPL